MKEIDFKNLTVEQEEELKKLLDVLSKSALSHIDGVSGDKDKITICAGVDTLSLNELKVEIDNLTPIAIDHFRMWFETMETIVRVRSKSKKKNFWSRFKFW